MENIETITVLFKIFWVWFKNLLPIYLIYLCQYKNWRRKLTYIVILSILIKVFRFMLPEATSGGEFRVLTYLGYLAMLLPEQEKEKPKKKYNTTFNEREIV